MQTIPLIEIKKKLATQTERINFARESGYYLSKLIGNETKNVILAHLSEENNDENIALTTVLSTLKEHDVDFSNISIAKQRTRTEVFVI